MILIDTSVYISALTDQELENVLSEASKKSLIMSSEVIDREIKKAVNHLRATNRKTDSEKLRELYDASIGGTIKLTDRVLSIADKYSDIVKEKFGKDKAKEMEDDLRIVASASIAGLKLIGTFNRKTMASDDIVEIYRNVNNSSKLKTPEFIKSKERLLEFFASS
ncbi:MAG: hypothetical protein HY513_00645 [Candidatus Aenigmarchaeota archaeon]|nr:hypothetical protein [Candidatus Aenigmarchaeota archaeon]